MHSDKLDLISLMTYIDDWSLIFIVVTSFCNTCDMAASLRHGATLPGKLKAILSPSTDSSITYVILITTFTLGGRLPTLTVNTS